MHRYMLVFLNKVLSTLVKVSCKVYEIQVSKIETITLIMEIDLRESQDIIWSVLQIRIKNHSDSDPRFSNSDGVSSHKFFQQFKSLKQSSCTNGFESLTVISQLWKKCMCPAL